MSAAKQMKAKIHIAKSALGLDEHTYRQMLQGITGKASCSLMNDFELQQVLDSLIAKGWKPSQPDGRKLSPASRHTPKDRKPVASKIRALWITLHKQGAVKDGSEQALQKFCENLTDIRSPDWLNARQASRVIEALKSWQQREEARRE